MSNQITSDISANDVPALQKASAPKSQRKTSKAVKPKTTKTEAVISLLMACRIFCTSVIETTALALSDPDGAVRA